MPGAEKFGARPIRRKVTKVRYSEEYTNALGEMIAIPVDIKVRHPHESPFAKVYYDFFKSLKNPPLVNVLFLGELFSRMDYVDANNLRSTVHLGVRQREDIADALQMSVKSVDRYITQLVDAGVLFRAITRGYYIVNPFFIAKGVWKYIAEFREEFDYSGGEWYFRGMQEYTHDSDFLNTDIPEEKEYKDPYEHSDLYKRVQDVIDAQDPYKNEDEENVQTQQI